MQTHYDTQIPTTPEEAADILISWMDDTEKLEWPMIERNEWPPSWGSDDGLLATGFNISSQIHFGLMMNVRNGWIHGQDSAPLVRYCEQRYGLRHADDISGLIQEALFAKLNNKPFDLDKTAKWTRDFYSKQGLDPLRWDQEFAHMAKIPPLKPGPISRVLSFFGIR